MAGFGWPPPLFVSMIILFAQSPSRGGKTSLSSVAGKPEGVGAGTERVNTYRFPLLQQIL
jgi:hypothetical protein